jgi:hypothetical protein
MTPTVAAKKPAVGAAAKVLPYTGREYLDSLDDGREIWIYGERVAKITEHPAFQNCAIRLACALLDFASPRGYRPSSEARLPSHPCRLTPKGGNPNGAWTIRCPHALLKRSSPTSSHAPKALGVRRVSTA